jgi:cyclic pyranopterin monophosphate synthase
MPAMPELTHLNDRGEAHMVDVSGKAETSRVAVARGAILLSSSTIALLRGGSVPKGDALATARVAGIMAAKKTSELIPLCHPLPISKASVDFTILDNRVEIEALVSVTGKTGVEMEALTAVSVAALTLYDMVKAVDKGAVITDIRLESKSGGKSGDYQRGSAATAPAIADTSDF